MTFHQFHILISTKSGFVDSEFVKPSDEFVNDLVFEIVKQKIGGNDGNTGCGVFKRGIQK